MSNNSQSPYFKRLFSLLFFIAVAVLSWILWKTYQADNLGFKDKTLWNWLELLVVPAILALIGYLLNKSQKETELKIADIRRVEERESAEQRANVDREIERDRQQQKALEDYLDRMTNLLLEKKLRESLPTDEIRSIARTRTLTLLKGLNGTRKSQVIQFLYESDLIGKFIGEKIIEPILDLSFADLQGLELDHAYLNGIVLSKANIRNSNFSFAKLIRANFYNSDLDESDLSWADLSSSNLKAGLGRTNLVSTRLDNAFLADADLHGAKIWHTSFRNANLQYANFMYKNHFGLHDESTLQLASLMNVDFTSANLTKALIKSEQLIGIKSLSGTILPNGQIFEEWKISHNLNHGMNFDADTIRILSDALDFLKED